jgi:hypothetical protein
MDDRGSILGSVQTCSGAHPASYPMGIEDYFPEVKELEREADHPTPSISDV